MDLFDIHDETFPRSFLLSWNAYV
jgi:integrase/recombinase XerD